MNPTIGWFFYFVDVNLGNTWSVKVHYSGAGTVENIEVDGEHELKKCIFDPQVLS